MPTNREKPTDDADDYIRLETLGIIRTDHNSPEALQSLSAKHLHSRENEQYSTDEHIAVLPIKQVREVIDRIHQCS